MNSAIKRRRALAAKQKKMAAARTSGNTEKKKQQKLPEKQTGVVYMTSELALCIYLEFLCVFLFSTYTHFYLI